MSNYKNKKEIRVFNESIKSINKIREYLREFYIYGFKSREEFTNKSLRTYDDEKRRISSWLGDYMKFKNDTKGKIHFISIDSRKEKHNPLFKAWKTATFTEGQITRHFILMDILSENSQVYDNKGLSVDDINEKFVLEYSECIDDDSGIGESVRKMLPNYEKNGLIIHEMEKNKKIYKMSPIIEYYNKDVLNYYSEVMPCGVIGSFLLDKKIYENCKKTGQNMTKDIFSFKHHYITSSIDSEILYQIFDAINYEKFIEIRRKDKNEIKVERIIPLKVMISVQNGRQYVMAYNINDKQIIAHRIDNIVDIISQDNCDKCDGINYNMLQRMLSDMLSHMWGVSTKKSNDCEIEHVEMIIRYEDNEQYIVNRLNREKRCGQVEQIDANHIRFFADIYDSQELIPWIRTFICRIEKISFSNKEREKMFLEDLRKMGELYSNLANE